MRKQWKPTFPPLVPEGSNLRRLSRGLGVCAGGKSTLKCVEVRSTSWTLLGLHCTASPHCTISAHFLQTVPPPPPSTALIVLRPEKGPGYSEALWQSQAEPECELDKRERKRINFLLSLGSLGEGAVFELSFPVCPLPFPKHTTGAHAQTRARTHSSSIPRSSLC